MISILSIVVILVGTSHFTANAGPIQETPPDESPLIEPITTKVTSSPSTSNSSSVRDGQNNTGIFVNGFNCTQFITQCKNSNQALNVNNTAIPAAVPSGSGSTPGASQDNVCENPKAQEMCGNFVYNPVTNNVNNSTIVQQTQNNNNWIQINNPPPSSFEPGNIPLINQIPGAKPS